MRFFFNHALTEHGHIFDLLRAGDPDVFIAASHARPETPLRECVDHFVAERPDPIGADMPEGYPEWLLAEAQHVRADAVVPYRHRIDLARHVDTFEKGGVRLLVSAGHETMEFIENKPKLMDFAESLGVASGPYQEFHDRGTFEDAHANLESFGTLCFKPSAGIGGIGYRKLVDDTDPKSAMRLLGSDTMVIGLTAFRNLLDLGPLDAPMMLMPYLSGPECSMDVACLDGRMLGAVGRWKRSQHQVVEDNAEVRAIAERLVAEFKLSGLINVQTRKHPDGRQCLLEINTRASGGVGQTAISGINLPHLLHEALQGRFPCACQVPTDTRIVTKRQRYIAALWEHQVAAE